MSLNLEGSVSLASSIPELRRYDQKMLMAYMDIPPTGPANGRVVFWQHGHNFYSEPYQDASAGRCGFESSVDRIGYDKSLSHISYNFNFVAANMKALMDELGIEKVATVGHSMGGMVVAVLPLLYRCDACGYGQNWPD